MKTLIIYCFVFFASLSLSAQANKESSILLFKEAVRIALQNNVNLNQQKNNLFARQVQKNQSMAAFLPGVQLRGTAVHTDGKQPNPDGGDLQDLSVDNINANIEAGMTLFNGLNRINTLNQNVNLFKAQISFVKRTEQEVIFNVTSQYLQVLLDQELLKIADETFKTQNIVLEQLDEQVKLGVRAEADLYTQDAQVRNLEVTALRAKVTLENDKALLGQTLQLDPAIPFEVELPLLENTFDISGFTLDSLYHVALSNRPDLRQAEFQTKANLYAYRSSINGYMPNIGLFASYGSQFISTLKDIPQYGSFNNQFTTVFPSLSYGINITIPIFDRLATRSTRVFNKVAYDNSKIQQDNMEKTIKIDVKRTYNNFLAAKQSLKASRVQYQAGELALRTQQESLVLGVSSQVAFALANQIYVQAAASQAQAEVTLIFQKVLMDYALGTLKIEDIQ